VTRPTADSFPREGCSHVAGEQTLVLARASRVWCRRLGPLAWAVLEDLALGAHSDTAGWVAPVGVRHVAAAIGVNKDTAARAVAVLGAAGLVTLMPVQGLNGRRRSGYRLNLPDETKLQGRPTNPDSHNEELSSAFDVPSCPNISDSRATLQEVNELFDRSQLKLLVLNSEAEAQDPE
jgi:hypothetical protein